MATAKPTVPDPQRLPRTGAARAARFVLASTIVLATLLWRSTPAAAPTSSPSTTAVANAAWQTEAQSASAERLQVVYSKADLQPSGRNGHDD